MIDTNFADLAQQLAARRDQLQAEIDAAMDAHGVICRAHDVLTGTATIVTAKAAEVPPTTGLCGNELGGSSGLACGLVVGHTGPHQAFDGSNEATAVWSA